MEKTAVLVTGGTGFVGSNLIVELFRRDKDLQIVCPARSSCDTPARSRILHAIHAAISAGAKGPLAKDWQDRLLVLDASLDDVADKLPAGDIDGFAVPPVTSLWHCASSTYYENTPTVDLHQVNVEGTRNVLSAAHRLGCPEFNYVSTAYVAGSRDGTIEEQLPASGDTFNNAYEETKAQAEQLVCAFAGEHEMSFRIFRPSIIVGDSTSFRSNSDGGLNKVIDSSFKLKKMILQRNPAFIASLKRFHVSLNPDMFINLIPIDHVIDEMLNICAAESASLNGIYHITRENQLSVADAMAAFSYVFGVGVECNGDPAEMNHAEKAFDRTISQFKPYLSSTKIFQRQAEARLGLSQTHADWRPSVEFVRALMELRSASANE